MALNPAELPVSVTLPRGWWASVIEAVQGAGEEYELLARDLQEFVIAATPQSAAKAESMDAPPYGENGPEPMVPQVVQAKAQPHAVRQSDLVEALRAVAERFPGHTELNHALRLLAQKLAEL